jgi:hypothetical protein
MKIQSTNNVRIKATRCCVLFDPKDGAIRHVNQVTTLEGAAETSEQAMEARTLRLAGRLGLDTTGLQLIHVDPEALAPGLRYRVDTRSRRLIERE